MFCDGRSNWEKGLPLEIEMLKEIKVKPYLYFNRCGLLYIDLLLYLTFCVQFSMKSSPLCKYNASCSCNVLVSWNNLQRNYQLNSKPFVIIKFIHYIQIEFFSLVNVSVRFWKYIWVHLHLNMRPRLGDDPAQMVWSVGLVVQVYLCFVRWGRIMVAEVVWP